MSVKTGDDEVVRDEESVWLEGGVERAWNETLFRTLLACYHVRISVQC